MATSKEENKTSQINAVQEIDQALNGEEMVFTNRSGNSFTVREATLGQLKKAKDLYGKLYSHVFTDFIAKDSDESVKSLYALLDMAFDGKCQQKEMDEFSQSQVREIIKFFLFG